MFWLAPLRANSMKMYISTLTQLADTRTNKVGNLQPHSLSASHRESPSLMPSELPVGNAALISVGHFELPVGNASPPCATQHDGVLSFETQQRGKRFQEKIERSSFCFQRLADDENGHPWVDRRQSSPSYRRLK